MDSLGTVLETTKAERLATGFVFTEGPLWHPEGFYYFVDIRRSNLHRLTPGKEPELVRANTGEGNGTTFDLQGRLVICEGGNRRVTRWSSDGRSEILVDRYEGKRLNRPNDVVCRSDGSLYFTDPGLRVPLAEREVPYAGVYRIAPDGTTTLVADCEYPNGLAFSPDERYLYVGDWDLSHKVVMRYEVAPDGLLSGGEVFHDMTQAPGEDAIDGVKVDHAGNVYACGPGGVWVLSPAGERLGLIELPEDPHNLAFGDDDAKTLYITALTGVYRIRVSVPGITPFNRPEEDR
jgi:gluconolactonase